MHGLWTIGMARCARGRSGDPRRPVPASRRKVWVRNMDRAMIARICMPHARVRACVRIACALTALAGILAAETSAAGTTSQRLLGISIPASARIHGTTPAAGTTPPAATVTPSRRAAGNGRAQHRDSHNSRDDRAPNDGHARLDRARRDEDRAGRRLEHRGGRGPQGKPAPYPLVHGGARAARSRRGAPPRLPCVGSGTVVRARTALDSVLYAFPARSPYRASATWAEFSDWARLGH